jgi:hypothetical protein
MSDIKLRTIAGLLDQLQARGQHWRRALLPSESALLSGAPSAQQTQPLPPIVEPIKEVQEPSEKKEPTKKAKGEGKKASGQG